MEMNTELYFVFSNLNAIILSIWIIFFILVSIRFYRPIWLKNISFLKLSFIAVTINVILGLFITWGQYYAWNISSDLTRFLINSPLSSEAPLPLYLEWIRPLFENNFGYFLYYVLGRIWLNIFLLFFVSFFLYFLFKFWKFYRGGFSEDGPLLLLVLMLISGWPGILVSVSLGFIFSLLLIIFEYFRGNKNINIEPVFLFTTFFALLFSNIILKYF